MSRWKKMVTAPKDGTVILVYTADILGPNEKVRTTYFIGDKQLHNDWAGFPKSVTPTYWMPVPAPPDINSKR